MQGLCCIASAWPLCVACLGTSNSACQHCWHRAALCLQTILLERHLLATDFVIGSLRHHACLHMHMAVAVYLQLAASKALRRSQLSSVCICAPDAMQLIGMTCPVKSGKAVCDMVVAQNFTDPSVVFAIATLLQAWAPSA